MNTPKITPIILAGGSGTRLWPLSRKDLPKQFCRLFDGPSLFQQTLLRVRDSQVFSEPVIVASRQHMAIIDQQLAELDVEARMVICEPVGRDTNAAILLAIQLCNRNTDTQMLVMPSDHQIGDENAFLHAVVDARHLAGRDGCIVTFGIKPAHPETGYGYLKAGTPILNAGGYLLERFIEKPNRAKAEELVNEPDIYWNSGIFLFNRDIIDEEASKFARRARTAIRTSIVDGEWIRNAFHPHEVPFSTIEPISFDYAIMEKTDRAAVVPIDAEWSDLGAWKAVWENSERDSNENLCSGPVYCSHTTNSVAISHGPTVGVAGLEDIVVIADRDAVLVASRNDPDNIKSMVSSMKADGVRAATTHSGEDRPWGRFDSLDRGKSHQVKRIRVEPGGRLSLQYHHHRSEHWIVVTGTATVTIDSETSDINPCGQVFIPQGAVHRLENRTTEPVEIIEVQYGEYLEEDDIVRIEDVYGRDAGETKEDKAA